MKTLYSETNESIRSCMACRQTKTPYAKQTELSRLGLRLVVALFLIAGASYQVLQMEQHLSFLQQLALPKAMLPSLIGLELMAAFCLAAGFNLRFVAKLSAFMFSLLALAIVFPEPQALNFELFVMLSALAILSLIVSLTGPGCISLDRVLETKHTDQC